MSLTTIGAGSMVFAVGNDWSGAAARTVGAGQTKVHEYLAPTGDTFWAQRVNGTVAAAGTVTTINDTAPTNYPWNLVAVEIRPALVLTPGAVAVDGVASGDTADGANIVANGLTTTQPGDLLLAFAASEGPTGTPWTMTESAWFPFRPVIKDGHDEQVLTGDV